MRDRNRTLKIWSSPDVYKRQVYLTSKSSNDDIPYHTWFCESLSRIYSEEGQQGLDREILRMLCEYATLNGTHPSITLSLIHIQMCIRDSPRGSQQDDIFLPGNEGQRTQLLYLPFVNAGLERKVKVLQLSLIHICTPARQGQLP